MVLLEFSMSPLDKGESLSEYVARSLDIIDKSGHLQSKIKAIEARLGRTLST